MDKQKADRINTIYNWLRVIILVLFFVFAIIGLTTTYNNVCHFISRPSDLSGYAWQMLKIDEPFSLLFHWNMLSNYPQKGWRGQKSLIQAPKIWHAR